MPSTEHDPLELLGRLIRTERSGLAHLARREGLEPEDAVDCVQDALCTFLGLAKHGEVPAGEAALRGLLAAIVRNAARNMRRTHHLARPHEPIDSPERSADDPSAEALVTRAEEHVRLRACVDRLCDTQRAVVMLRLLEERRGEDVALTLGITRGHVDVLVHRAKSSLRACMAETEVVG